MESYQNWIIVAAINDLNYCLDPKRKKKDIIKVLHDTRKMLRNINNPKLNEISGKSNVHEAIKEV